jgi:hypothetical protein
VNYTGAQNIELCGGRLARLARVGCCSPKASTIRGIPVVLLCRHNREATAKWPLLPLDPRGARPGPSAFWEKPEGSHAGMRATVPSRQEAAWERAGPKRRSGSGGVARNSGSPFFGVPFFGETKKGTAPAVREPRHTFHISTNRAEGAHQRKWDSRLRGNDGKKKL